MKKSHSKIQSCLKMNLCVCVRKFGVSDKDKRGLSLEGGENCLKYLKRDGIVKRRGETILIRGTSWIKGWMHLKEGGPERPYELSASFLN